ncbi:MAG: cysteine--tRNA ligase [Chlamydiia bacterium]|nr:cysteine--tRNA ligase [Chlamydiia bacterium]
MAGNETRLTFFNTERREKEVFAPLKGEQVKMYTCGPTVYNFAHIGNFRTYVFEDLLRRTIKHFGYKVEQVMNITDVDDKTIRGAIAQDCTLEAYVAPYRQAFFDDLETLGIDRVEHYPAATEYIPEMIDMIQALIAKKVAYQGNDGSVYFSIRAFPRYGCLSHLKLDELQVGASDRVAADEYDKDNASDFVLWKAYDPERDGNIYWESPFGPGRPGWHLECSTMAMQILGDTIDIHVGGVDNIFPHHENEIAQSEACSGKRFVKLWMHSEHLLVDNKKMSKSLGNFYTLRDLLDKGFTGRQVRYMLLQTHYRTQLNFTLEGLEAVKHSLQRLDDFVWRLQEIRGASAASKVKVLVAASKEHFKTALADDLNISVALAALFDLVREVNAACDRGEVGQEDAELVLSYLGELNTVLNVVQFEKPSLDIKQEILEALRRRDEAREERNWALADELRDYILEAGYIIDDTPTGGRLKQV